LSRLCFGHGGDSSTRPQTNWLGAPSRLRRTYLGG
jgi:hypothetical protein